MKAKRVGRNRNENLQQMLILLLAMILHMFLLGRMLGGIAGVMVVTIVSLALLIVSFFFFPPEVLKNIGSRRLDPGVYRERYHIVHKACEHEGLSFYPTLYSIPAKCRNGFVAGKTAHAGIVCTDLLLHNLNLRQLSGKTGHEIAHIHNEYLWVMSVADVMLRRVNCLSMVGQFMYIFVLPVIVSVELHSVILPILLFLFLSTICVFLHLALSRTCEFEADRVGGKLVGDVYGLVTVLYLLERYHKRLLCRFLRVSCWLRISSLLQKHLYTMDRINKLLSMTEPGKQWLPAHWQYSSPLQKVSSL